MTVENLRQFVRRQSDVKITLPDCLKQYDVYAAKFVKALHLTASNGDNVQTILIDAENGTTKLETEHVMPLNIKHF